MAIHSRVGTATCYFESLNAIYLFRSLWSSCNQTKNQILAFQAVYILTFPSFLPTVNISNSRTPKLHLFDKWQLRLQTETSTCRSKIRKNCLFQEFVKTKCSKVHYLFIKVHQSLTVQINMSLNDKLDLILYVTFNLLISEDWNNFVKPIQFRSIYAVATYTSLFVV